MKIQVLDNILDKATFDKTVSIYKDLINSQEMEYQGGEWNRLFYHRHWYFDYLHKNQLYDLAKKRFGEDIIPSYSFLSHYLGGHSSCPIHQDRFPQCLYTIDMLVMQNEPWAINVDFKPYVLLENQGLCYSGCNHIHFRSRIKNGNKISLAFFHYADSIHEGKNLN